MCGYLAKTYLPLEALYIPAWLLYGYICGTVATGLWVLGHECGHGSFSDHWILNDSLGYILHTALLVPYFSWQWSHFVHHSKTNHLTEGETHVPLLAKDKRSAFYKKMKEIVGTESFAII